VGHWELVGHWDLWDSANNFPNLDHTDMDNFKCKKKIIPKLFPLSH